MQARPQPPAATALTVALTPASAAALALPASASPEYKPAHRQRTKLRHWVALADQLGVGYADLSLRLYEPAGRTDYIEHLIQTLRKRISGVRLVLKRARSSAARRKGASHV